ncbi:hypothetical protein M426DRAFT_171344 [Hypoxylon sp. CI-4A]|nr:hypothetical protein M426DRAFT_171344 [Hypoxylon sp. CI-4A]
MVFSRRFEKRRTSDFHSCICLEISRRLCNKQKNFMGGVGKDGFIRTPAFLSSLTRQMLSLAIRVLLARLTCCNSVSASVKPKEMVGGCLGGMCVCESHETTKPSRCKRGTGSSLGPEVHDEMTFYLSTSGALHLVLPSHSFLVNDINLNLSMPSSIGVGKVPLLCEIAV